MLENNYFELLEDIKSTLITTRNKVIENANKDLIIMYYNIGVKLIENNNYAINPKYIYVMNEILLKLI